MQGSLKQLIVSLLYPAFLGNMLYAASELLFKSPSCYDLPHALLAAALLLHFALDWLHSQGDPARPRRYGVVRFATDLLIVCCLYIAMRIVLGEGGGFIPQWPAWMQGVVFWLIVAKACAVVWELSDAEDRKTCLARWGAATDALFLAAYGLAGWLVPEPYLWPVLAFCLLSDGVLYVLLPNYGQRNPAGSATR